MIYLNNDDLTADSYQAFIDSSTGDAPAVIDAQEKRAVDLVKTYLSGRYDVDKIFTAPVVRNELLVDIVAKITLYRIFRRNAARKVSSDIKEDYDWAIKELGKINAGMTKLDNLPKPTDTSGNVISTSMFGNNTNPDFYI